MPKPKSPSSKNRPAPKELGSLAEQAYIQLEEMIVRLMLPPGASLSEAILSAKTGIGRTPIREALKRLEHQGLVTSIPRKGLIVRDMRVEDQFALLEVLRPLDRLIACKAARRITPAQSDALKLFAESMKEAALAEDLHRYLLFDQEFDRILHDAARNTFASDIVTPLYSHSRRFWCSFQRPGDLAKLANHHAEVMLAVAEGNEEKAAAASDALIDYVEAFSKAAIGLP
jgi:DNA-binding GntR family transcriptional regulator